MAVDHDGDPETRERFLYQPRKGSVIRRMQPENPILRLAGVELSAIDFSAVAHNPRYDAETRIDARIRCVDTKAQRAVEHRRIEFVRCAVHVHEGAGKPRRYH